MKNTPVSSVASKGAPVLPGAFVFCDRASGALRFRVDAGPGGSLPVQHAATLLAIHCLVRGQKPGDFAVLVVPRGSLLGSVGRRAQQLIEAGQAIGCELPLSRREREVLECVLRSLSNKEIAARLHISERTIKFHVSALLSKFKVHDRFELMREARVGFVPNAVPPDTLFGFAMPPSKVQSHAEPPPRLQVLPLAAAGERV